MLVTRIVIFWALLFGSTSVALAEQPVAYVDPRVAGAPQYRAPRVMPLLADADLQAALGRAEPDVRQCLEQALHGARASLRARVRVDGRRGVTITQTLRPRSAQAEACVEVAIRRWVQPLLSQRMQQPLTGTLRVTIGGGAVVPPRPPPPRPPPPPPPALPPPSLPPPDRYDENEVHAALDAMRASLVECVPGLSPGIAGRMTLRVSVRPDGSLTLMSVQVPPGVAARASLVCLGSRVGWLRVAGPTSERLVVHHIDLGR